MDRCELWGFIREINSDISHVKNQFFPAGTTFTQLFTFTQLLDLQLPISIYWI